ncbi:MAG TPA: hypothetical protein DCE42_13675 [Myxococcales bacterium]|nr:hypothetical protein [Deltaproteobacteria bacterium]MBU54286.1 hypothetical protein [Deltaproteobacteria bacterium]HAA55806.1 hypothetical protein [Myxococcales bacterium]|tara:strand:- start:221 stop:1012 length:792 start_codon:yes stop_codon:yes gene_type:complete
MNQISRVFGILLAATLIPLLPTEAFADTFIITIAEAQIAPKKKNKLRWDTGFGQTPKPDAYVIMEVSGKRFTSPIIKNNFNPKWNVSWKVELQGNERLYFVVKEKDLLGDDLIGKGNVLLKDANKASLSFGQVLSFTVKAENLTAAKKRAAAPPVVRKVVKRVTPKPPVVRKVVKRVTPKPPVVRKVEKKAPVKPVVRKVEKRVAPKPPVVRKVEKKAPVKPAPRKVEPAPRKVIVRIKPIAPKKPKAPSTRPASRPASTPSK